MIEGVTDAHSSAAHVCMCMYVCVCVYVCSGAASPVLGGPRPPAKVRDATSGGVVALAHPLSACPCHKLLLLLLPFTEITQRVRTFPRIRTAIQNCLLAFVFENSMGSPG